ncbi:MAG: TldD/PmbA family protein [Acholeplasmatales bacterium]|nr:MAG: TldD/PmbA family protein [Acholeplasmatales bacterium]
MLDKRFIESLLNTALESAADFAEVFIEEKKQSVIVMQSNTIEQAVNQQVFGVGIRVAQGHQSVYGYTNSKNHEELLKLAQDLSQSFAGERVRETVKLGALKTGTAHAIKKMPDTVDMAEKASLVRRANQAARAYDEAIKQVSVSYMDYVQNVWVASSEDIFTNDQRVRTRLGIHSVAGNGKDMQSGFNGPGGHYGFEFYDTFDVEAAAQEASRTAITMLQADECPSGVMPVVIDNGFGGVIFHEACGHSLEATSVAKNASVFSGKQGEQIANPIVTAIDDGTIENAWGSANFDDEGRPQEKRVLIKEGVLQTYMVDYLNGKRMQTASTGSGRRESYKYPPTSRMSNTYIDNGDSTFDEIIAATPYGLYAKKMGGGSVNPSTGDFNFAVMEAYMIRDGKISEPVKGATLIGTGKDALKKIDMVGNNLLRAQGMCGSVSGSIPTDVGQPTLRVSSMTVGGRKGGQA